MVLNRNPKNYFAEVEQIAFCPSNMVPGIEASPDKMLQVCEAGKERGEGGGKGRGGRDGRKEGGEREGGEGREGKGRKKGMEGGGVAKFICTCTIFLQSDAMATFFFAVYFSAATVQGWHFREARNKYTRAIQRGLIDAGGSMCSRFRTRTMYDPKPFLFTTALCLVDRKEVY